jgi:hypothetical protein
MLQHSVEFALSLKILIDSCEGNVLWTRVVNLGFAAV